MIDVRDGAPGELDQPSDEELLARCRGDAEAFGRFYERHERAVLAYFRRRTGDAELAADLTAETFATALLVVGRFRPDAATPAAAWLYGIARNVLTSSLRRRRVEDRARRRLQLEPLTITDDLVGRIDALAADARVADLLGRLAPEQAEALRARVIDDESYDQIADRLRCSEAVVRQRVSRGLARLKRITAGEEGAL